MAPIMLSITAHEYHTHIETALLLRGTTHVEYHRKDFHSLQVLIVERLARSAILPFFHQLCRSMHCITMDRRKRRDTVTTCPVTLAVFTGPLSPSSVCMDRTLRASMTQSLCATLSVRPRHGEVSHTTNRRRGKSTIAQDLHIIRNAHLPSRTGKPTGGTRRAMYAGCACTRYTQLEGRHGPEMGPAQCLEVFGSIRTICFVNAKLKRF
jgi:hypothetical protein